MDPHKEDRRLLEAVSRGEEDALAALMARHKQAIFRFALRCLRDEADAAEVVEETFFRAYRKAGAFKPGGTVKSWLFTIALNLSRDRLRRRKKHAGTLSLDAPLPGRTEESGSLSGLLDSGAADPAEETLSRDTTERIEAMIEALPEKLRFPFIFCVLEDHSYDECAEVLETNRKAVETRIYRARQRLRQALSHSSGIF